jgi:hypothetical protein
MSENIIDDGGNAFPLPVTSNENGMYETRETGMSLRDYFAAKAVVNELRYENRPHENYNLDNAAKRAYKIADAMIKARG